MKRQIFSVWGSEKPFAREEDRSLQEHLMENISGDGVDRFTDVTEPEVHFFPACGKGPHPAVLVCPGGGYHHLAWSKEGLDIASFLNLNGVSAFVLKYRCPDRRDAARADAVRTMRIIRARAEEFRIRPDRVGIIGFSAGAHLAAVLSAGADNMPYPTTDEIDRFDYRPNFTMLIYPAYLADDDLKLTAEFKIDAAVPPTFLVQTEDDFARVENSLGWYLALKRAGVPAEMHLFASGGHGYGLMPTGTAVSEWGIMAGKWLRRQLGTDICG